MIKNISTFIVMVLFLVNIYGCVALLAGAAGGAGTAVWLSGKLTQEANVSSDKSIKAVKSALDSLGLLITKETKKEEVTQIISKYTDGKTVWIDIRPVTLEASRIDVRVGAVTDEEASRKIMDEIIKYL
jgi:hypothetical protein